MTLCMCDVMQRFCTPQAMQNRDSCGPKVAAVGIKIHTGRRWSASRELEVAEATLRQKANLGTEQWQLNERALATLQATRPTQYTVKRDLEKEEVWVGVKEAQGNKMVGLGQQGAWTKWKNVLRWQISWANTWQADFNRIRFLVQVVYDTSPSPAKLQTWGSTVSLFCPHCKGRGSLDQLLSSFPRELGGRRYHWHYNKVLKAADDDYRHQLQINIIAPLLKSLPLWKLERSPATAPIKIQPPQHRFTLAA